MKDEKICYLTNDRMQLQEIRKQGNFMGNYYYGLNYNDSYQTLLNLDKLKYTINETVFFNLFNHREYAVELYHALYPQEDAITVDDITEISTHKLPDKYADDFNHCIAILIKDQQMVLIEPLYEWLTNALLDFMFYWESAITKYLKDTGQSLYQEEEINIPAFDFITLYTGKNTNHPDDLNLSRDYFNGESSFFNMTATVISHGKDNDIIDQYISFTRVVDYYIHIYGRDIIAIQHIIDECIESDYLRNYFIENKEELSHLLAKHFN